MNDWDRNNLSFLRSLSGDALTEWAKTITADDLDYAIELLRRGTTELVIKELEEIDQIDHLDLTEAQTAIAKIAVASK